jgi:hypothetical protein
MAKQSLTTEQLAEKCIRDIKKMTRKKKAECRQHLAKAFCKPKLHDDDTERSGVLEFMLKYKIDLTLDNYIDIAFMSTPPEGIAEDGEFLASVPEVILYGPRLVQ